MTAKNIFVSFLVGFIFAAGLNLSGMTQPHKVIGFLDLFGHWDPSLMFVMIGAIGVHASYFFLVKPRFSKPILAETYQLPTKKDLTTSLILGSAIFGIGWGLGGYCPGPAITSLVSNTLNPFVFIGAMLLGMTVYRLIEPKLPLSK